MLTKTILFLFPFLWNLSTAKSLPYIDTLRNNSYKSISKDSIVISEYNYHEVSENDYLSGRFFAIQEKRVAEATQPYMLSRNRKIHIINDYYLWNFQIDQGWGNDEHGGYDGWDDFMICKDKKIIFFGVRYYHEGSGWISIDKMLKDSVKCTENNRFWRSYDDFNVPYKQYKREKIREVFYRYYYYNKGFMKDLTDKYFAICHYRPGLKEFVNDTVNFIDALKDQWDSINIDYLKYKETLTTKDTITLHRWLRSPTIQFQMYAIKGLTELAERGYKLNTEEKGLLKIISERLKRILEVKNDFVDTEGDWDAFRTNIKTALNRAALLK